MSIKVILFYYPFGKIAGGQKRTTFCPCVRNGGPDTRMFHVKTFGGMSVTFIKNVCSF